MDQRIMMRIVLVLTPITVALNMFVMGRDHGFQPAMNVFTTACLSFVCGGFLSHLRAARQEPK